MEDLDICAQWSLHFIYGPISLAYHIVLAPNVENPLQKKQCFFKILNRDLIHARIISLNVVDLFIVTGFVAAKWHVDHGQCPETFVFDEEHGGNSDSRPFFNRFSGVKNVTHPIIGHEFLVQLLPPDFYPNSPEELKVLKHYLILLPSHQLLVYVLHYQVFYFLFCFQQLAFYVKFFLQILQGYCFTGNL